MSDAFVLCADDYALTAPISRAIVALAEAGRISAVSCMTASRHWPEHAAWLKPLRGKVDIGLHLTLVDEKPLTSMPQTAPDGRLPSISRMIVKTQADELARDEISAEIAAQAKAFVDALGFAPAHIDGHLHTHVFPTIRDIVLELADTLSPKPWLRNVHDRWTNIARRGVAFPKAVFISRIGLRFDGRARAAGHRINDTFSGMYAFSKERRDYGALFERFLRARGRSHVVLCHPGEETDDEAAWAHQRFAEFRYLSGPAFPERLAAHGLRVARFSEL